jgi:tRNA (guanine10-N2)-dimethyltransferase
MKTLLLLSKHNLKLSITEAFSLLEIDDYGLKDCLLITNKKIKHELIERLAYTKKAYTLLFESTYKDLTKNIQNFNWQKVYKKDFCVRRFHLSNSKDTLKEKDIADIIWNKLKNPKVNLKTPKTSIEFLLANNKVYCCLLTHENKEPFEERRAHLRPELHPTSLSPKLARACINLTGVKKGRIADPFCGSGGILIEAGLINLKPVGYDINQIQLNRSKINLDHYKVKSYKLIKEDATDIKKKFNYIITDLPYGRNTSVKDIDGLYLKFLRNLKKTLGKKAVIIFPSNVNHKKLIKTARLKIEKEFIYYLHKSLSKTITVLH